MLIFTTKYNQNNMMLYISYCFHVKYEDKKDHHHIRHNNPGRVTASLRIRLQTSLSLATVHQFWIFNFFTSSWTASLHLEQGLPTPLLPSGLPSIILLTISSFFILWTWPAHLSLAILISVMISLDLYSSYNSLLYLIRHSPFSFTGPYIFLSIFRSNIPSFFGHFHSVPKSHFHTSVLVLLRSYII